MKAFLFIVRWVLIGFGVAFIAIVSTRYLDDDSSMGRHSTFADAVTKAAPAVVSIRTMTRHARRANRLLDDPLIQGFFDLPSRGESTTSNSSLGSGVIIDTSGVIVTNFHVIKGAEAIQVSLRDGRRAPAIVIGTDPDTDLAVLRVDLEHLPQIEVGDSNKLKVGDIVLAIGNPLGIGQTVTQGIVSATGRNRVGINTFENFIQTDAAINFGNSGGALVNARGELVGINAVRLDSEGIGFAIPTSIAVKVARQILTTGGVVRGWIGIDARDLTSTLRKMLRAEQGIVVIGVMHKGPADTAGIAADDVITHIDGKTIEDSKMAIEIIAGLAPGSRVAVRVWRGGEAFDSQLIVSQRPAQPR